MKLYNEWHDSFFFFFYLLFVKTSYAMISLLLFLLPWNFSCCFCVHFEVLLTCRYTTRPFMNLSSRYKPLWISCLQINHYLKMRDQHSEPFNGNSSESMNSCWQYAPQFFVCRCTSCTRWREPSLLILFFEARMRLWWWSGFLKLELFLKTCCCDSCEPFLLLALHFFCQLLLPSLPMSPSVPNCSCFWAFLALCLPLQSRRSWFPSRSLT